MAKKRNKTNREKLSEDCDLVTKLLMWEMTGGIIPLPKGASGYNIPPIPFSERSRFLSDTKKGLLVDLKVNPDSEESVFDIMKGELGGSAKQRDSNKGGDRGNATSPDGEYDDPDADRAGILFAGGSTREEN
jgi:hypothetical protein